MYYTVTALHNDNEIGYGEGESLRYALADCGASISPMFENAIVELSIFNKEGIFRRDIGRVYLTLNGESAITTD